MGYAEFDFVALDTEHTAHGYESVIHQLRAAEVVGLHPLIRPPGQEPSLISRAFDLVPLVSLFQSSITPNRPVTLSRQQSITRTANAESVSL